MGGVGDPAAEAGRPPPVHLAPAPIAYRNTDSGQIVTASDLKSYRPINLQGWEALSGAPGQLASLELRLSQIRHETEHYLCEIEILVGGLRRLINRYYENK